jgi:hypothetical protein
MQDKEFNDLLEDLKSVGLLGPLSRFGSGLDDVVEIKGRYRKGARAFLDPVTGARYVSHANGYVRRYMYEKNFWRTGEGLTSRYCLNRRQPKQKMIKDGRTWTTGVFVLLPNEEDRLNLIVRAIRNYRKSRPILLKK